MRDELGDRIKAYEAKYMETIPQGHPVMIRLDGKAFHTFTHDLKKPFDINFIAAMDYTCLDLVNFTNARLGFVQSDEISLMLYNNNPAGQVFYNGRVQKLCSILAGYAALRFTHHLAFCNLEHLVKREPLFDCRVFSVGNNLMEACNVFIWREKDAERNAILTLGQYYNGHKWMDGRSTAKVAAWLDNETTWKKKYSWRELHGEYFRRVKRMYQWSESDLLSLPLKHEARKNPNKGYERTETRVMHMSLSQAINKIDVVFNGEKPKYEYPVQL